MTTDYVPADWSTDTATRPDTAIPPTGRVAQPPIDPTEARELLSDELYMARVWALIRREEAARNGGWPTSETTQAAPTVPLPSTQGPGVPGWVWKYSALALSSGGFVALAGYGVGAAAPGLAHIDDILSALGQAVMSIAVLAVLIGLLLAPVGGRRRGTNGGTTVNIKKAVFKRSRFNG